MGRSVIVTGAGGGVGRAVAMMFAKTKDRLILTSSQPEQGKATAAAIRDGGGEAIYIDAHLEKKIDVRNIIAEAIDSYGGINVLANCASSFVAKPLIDSTDDDYETIFDQNVRAAFLLNRGVAREIIRGAKEASDGGYDTARSGAIVNMVSTEAITASADHALFAATQGAIVQLTKAVALTLSPYGARANAVGVAAIKSEIDDVELKTREDRKAMIDTTPLARSGDPEEAAGAVEFLCSAKASFITGQTLMVDGGRLALYRKHKGEDVG